LALVIIYVITKKDKDKENIINKYWFLNLLSQFINIVIKTIEIILLAVFDEETILLN